LRAGCCPDPEPDADGKIGRHLIRGHEYKTAADEHGNHQSAGVEREVPWVAITAVVNAIRVLERMVGEGNLLFDHHAHDLHQTRAGTGSLKLRCLRTRIEDFVVWANTEAASHHLTSGVIPPDPHGKIGTGRFRRSMAMLTDQFAGSEIALGIQPKHVATRALANRCTQGYAASDAVWAEHLDSAIDAARFGRLEDLYRAHKDGEAIGYGPAADRMANVFAHIQQTATARSGDATVERALLRKTRISIRFGTLNHCAFDETNPAGAVCLENAITPPGHRGPLPDRCRPDRCANSILSPQHIPIWDSERRTLLTLVNNPGLPSWRKAVLQRELTDVEAVLRKTNLTTPTEDQP
jgi:hypothetical protein